MEDLLKIQIHENCRLALPEGLKDLMWDISREVLRAKPQDIFKFITDYLSALLVTRENLSVAAHICGDVCNNICHLALEEELTNIGLSERTATNVKNVIQEHFAESKVNESNLLLKLVNIADIDENQLHDIQIAVRKAYLHYQANRKTYYEISSSESDVDEVDNAVRHTLHLYKQTKPSEEQYNKAAANIQAAYRGYGIRRHKNCTKVKEQLPDSDYEVEADKWPEDDEVHEDALHATNKNIRFNSTGHGTERNFPAVRKSEEFFDRIGSKPYLITASSTSLAGSFLNLPKYRPYSSHNCHEAEVLEQLEEVPEKEHTNIDYTLEESRQAHSLEESKPIFMEDPDKVKDLSKKIISFHEIPSVIEDVADDAENMSDYSVEEDIRSEASAEVNSYIVSHDEEMADCQQDGDGDVLE